MLTLDAHARSAAAADRVWALLADARTWKDWAGFDDVVVEKGSGLGEVRRTRRGRVRGREIVTVWEPPRRFGYDFVEGLPVRDYHAEVTLEPMPDGGTEIRWRSSFRARMPGTGWALQLVLQRFIRRITESLARAAER